MAMDIGRPYLELLVLEAMPQQPGGLLGMVDDWTGVTSSAERRRVQNRLNQRAHRKRKQNDGKKCLSRNSQSPLLSDYAPSKEASSSSERSEDDKENWSPSMELWSLFHSAAERSHLDREKLTRVATICKLGIPEQQKAISEFEKWVHSCQKIGSPRADHLLVLVKFNVFRALISNGGSLGYPAGGGGMDDDDALSPFTDPSHAGKLTSHVPAALRPTKLQRQILHHPWIDVLPVPGMRDNLLRAGDTYDDMALFSDLVGFFSASTERTGMIIWGDPWDPNSWEVTESFLRYWGWTIRGCEELLRATNYWREKRGEIPLSFDRTVCEEVNE